MDGGLGTRRSAIRTTWSVHVYPPVSDTNIALAGVASASSVDQYIPQQCQAKYVNDGKLSTRWCSAEGAGHDTEWVQVMLAAPASIGEVVLHWEAAYGVQYAIEGSADGVHWQTLAKTDHGQGGTETLHVDAGQPISYVRMQGTQRFDPAWGHALWEVQTYPVRP